MGQPKKSNIKKIVSILHRNKRKVISLDYLSKLVGIYPDVLGEELSYFCPLILMDPSINIRDYVEVFRAYIAEPIKKEEPKKKIVKKESISKAELSKYKGVVDFAYKKFTSIGGLFDPSYNLTEHDIRVLEKLLEKENRRFKTKKKKSR